jgi:hypothetical protein
MSTQDGAVVAQAVASLIELDLEARAQETASALSAQHTAFTNAMGALNKVRGFIGDPAHIVGNRTTKHGEIAERVEVAVRRARDFMARQFPEATFAGAVRNGPTDYRIGLDNVQSKFINGVQGTLREVHRHMCENPGYGSSGSFYHIPHEQHEVVRRVLAGARVEGLGARSLRAIAEQAREIERAAGRPFAEAVRPGVSTYSDVQQGRIHSTMDRHERDVRVTDRNQRAQITSQEEPTLIDVAKGAASGAAVGAGVRMTATLYRKWTQGKSPFRGEFSAADWKDLGLDGLVGGAQGGVSAGAILALTQYTDLAAPFAATFVSSAMAVGNLAGSHRRGEIGFDEMVELGEIACAETALLGIASLIGQTVIPIPILGAILGAVAGRILASQGRRCVDAIDSELANALAARFNSVVAALNAEQQRIVRDLVAELDRLGELTDLAFDIGRNSALQLQASLLLAEVHGVSPTRRVADVAEMDQFMLGGAE